MSLLKAEEEGKKKAGGVDTIDVPSIFFFSRHSLFRAQMKVTAMALISRAAGPGPEGSYGKRYSTDDDGTLAGDIRSQGRR